MKKIGKILLAIICLFALSTKVKAIYNGQGSVGYPSGGSTGASNCGSNICTYSNHEHGPIIKAQLYYVNNGNFTPQGNPVYYMGSTYKSSANGAVKAANQAYINSFGNQITIMNELNGLYYGDFKSASNILRGYFGDNDNSDITNLPNANLVAFFNQAYGTSGNGYQERMNQETQVANREAAASYGYRLIFEPALTFSNANKLNSSLPKRTILTPIEIKQFYDAASSKPAFSMCHAPMTKDKPSCSTPVSERRFGAIYQISFLHTEFRDVGVDGASEDKCQNTSWNDFNKNSGCAMNIIDVGKKLQPHYCYDKKVTGSVSCEGIVDTESEGDFLETYTKRECTAKESQDNTNSEHGKRVAVSNSCALYARESGHVILPGGISKNNKTYNINNGSYFAWPAKKNHVGMHAIIKDVVDFTIVRTDGGACSDAEVNTLVEAAKSKIKGATFGLKLTGGDFDPINGQALVPANQQEWTNANITVNGNTRKFKLAKLSYMEINEATNRIYNRTLNKIFHRTSVQSKDEVDRGEGVVSLAINNKTTGTQKYKLELSDLVFGIDGGAFEVKNYSCQLETHREPCECPPGKLSKSLEDYVNAGRTCRQAQEEAERTGYCEAFCTTSTGQKVNITTCVLNEIKKGTDEDSAQKICEDKEPSCRKTCLTEAGTYIPVNQYNSCITQTVAKGFSLTEAQEKCDNKFCGCVVDGKTPESYIACIDRGGSKNICTAMYCDKQNVCKQCMYCTTGCNWSEKKLTDSQVAFVKVCDNTYPGEADCGHRVITNKTCVQQKLGVSDIITALNKGTKTVSELDDAIYECSDTYNVSTKRDNLVFRTIDLNNPFPGDSVKTTAYSNNSQTSRYPGSNWDSAITVKEDILEARGAKGDELYKKSPLYTITITPSQMKKIREYNKKQDNPLSDFKLTCAEGTDYCYSDFLHGKAKDCEGNKCLTINTDTQKSKCANIKNNKTDFINCYESKN